MIVKEDATICTDKMNSYKDLLQNNIDLVQFKSGKSKQGIYNIQHK